MSKSKYVDFETRSSIHIYVTKSMYVEFRKLLLDHNLSAQSVYQELMGLIVEGDEYMEQLLDRMETEKREKIVNKVRKTDAESIYKAIANKDASTKN